MFLACNITNYEWDSTQSSNWKDLVISQKKGTFKRKWRGINF